MAARCSSGHGAAQLDGEVGNAAARIDGPAGAVRHDSRGGAGVDAARHVPQRSGGGWPGSISSDTSNSPRKNHEPAPWWIRQRVLADPAEAGRARVGALQQRRGIHADLRFEGAARLRRRRAARRVEAVAQHVVVVVAPGVAGNPGELGFGERGRVGLRSVVELAHADDGARGGEQVARIVAHGGAAVGEVAHLAREAAGVPLVVAGGVGRGQGRRGPGEFEAALARQLPEPFGGKGCHYSQVTVTPSR